MHVCICLSVCTCLSVCVGGWGLVGWTRARLAVFWNKVPVQVCIVSSFNSIKILQHTALDRKPTKLFGTSAAEPATLDLTPTRIKANLKVLLVPFHDNVLQQFCLNVSVSSFFFPCTDICSCGQRCGPVPPAVDLWQCDYDQAAAVPTWFEQKPVRDGSIV